MFTTLDKSNYLKALLILAKADQNLPEEEKDYLRDVAKRLGFSKDFYEDTLRTLLINDNLNQTPIKFSDTKIAELLINDGLELAHVDNRFSPEELHWLKSVAIENEIPEKRFDTIVESYTESNSALKEMVL